MVGWGGMGLGGEVVIWPCGCGLVVADLDLLFTNWYDNYTDGY